MIWAIFPWNRCRAVLEPKKGSPYFGRCELIKKHKGDHAIERGFDIVTWMTFVTSQNTEY